MVASIDALILQSRSDVSFICKAPSKESAAQLLIWQRSCGSINRPWLRNSAESWLPIMVSLRLRHSLPLCMGGRLWFWHVQIPNQPQCDDKASVSVCLFFCCVDSLEHPNPSKSLAIGRSFRFRNSTCHHQQGYWTLSRPSLCCQPSRLSEQFCPPTGEQHSCSKIISKIHDLRNK